MSEEGLSELYDKEDMKGFAEKLISDFLEALDRVRDFVLDAPILSNDVYKFRNYLHEIKAYIKLERNVLEKML